jgi:hypothetical protein
MSNSSEQTKETSPATPAVGRNEPCPCGSRKKYKRCCGIAAPPKLTRPSVLSEGALSEGAGSSAQVAPSNPFEGVSPELMMQMTQALSRLPKAQLQRFQVLMQKAMSGRDITREAADFERTLPNEFKTLMQTMAASAGFLSGTAAQGTSSEGSVLSGLLPDIQTSKLPDTKAALLGASPESVNGEGDLTEEQARQLVSQAAAAGKISAEQAQELLGTSGSQETQGSSETPAEVPAGSESRLKKFWKSFSGQ